MLGYLGFAGACWGQHLLQQEALPEYGLGLPCTWSHCSLYTCLCSMGSAAQLVEPPCHLRAAEPWRPPLAPCLLTLSCLAEQVESALAVQNLKPTIDAIKAQYGEDKRKIQRETTELYKESGVNPLASTPVIGHSRVALLRRTEPVSLTRCPCICLLASTLRLPLPLGVPHEPLYHSRPLSAAEGVAAGPSPACAGRGSEQHSCMSCMGPCMRSSLINW